MYRPSALAEALDLLQQHGEDARLIAGGQSLVPMMNLRVAMPAVLIDLGRIAALTGIREDGETIRIGAGTRQQALLTSSVIRDRLPLLAAATRYIGHFSTRSRGTVGGSLANADPSSELALVAVTLDAQLTVQSREGARVLAARAFFVDTMTTALAPSEILTEIAFPASPRGTRVAFREHARRHGDFATVAAAVQLSPAERVLRAGLGAIGPVPTVCDRIAAAFAEGTLGAGIEAVVDSELDAIDIMPNVHIGIDYRRRLAASCLADCLREVIGSVTA